MDIKYDSSLTLSNRKDDILSTGTLPWSTSPELDVKDKYVQRSVSLKLDSRPTYRLSIERDARDINGNFELAHLLAKASSWDAKLARELQEEDQNSSRINLQSLPDWSSLLEKKDSNANISSTPCAEEHLLTNQTTNFRDTEKQILKESTPGVVSQISNEKVALPLRYRQILGRRRVSRSSQGISPTSPTNSSLTFSSLLLPHPSGGTGGDSISSIHKLDVLPEAPDDPGSGIPDEAGFCEGVEGKRPGLESKVNPGSSNEMSSASLDQSITARQRDAKAAILWALQEIKALKQQDRSLLRQLLDLGAQIHRFGGMESCQSLSGDLGQGHSTSMTSCSSNDLDTSGDATDQLTTSSLVTVNIEPPTPSRKSLGPLSFKSIDHFLYKS